MKKLLFSLAFVCALSLCANAQDKPKKDKKPKQEAVDCCNKNKEHQCDSTHVHGNHDGVHGNSEGHAHQNNGNHNGQNKDHQNNGNHNGQNKDHQNNGNHNGQNKQEHPKAGAQKPGMK